MLCKAAMKRVFREESGCIFQYLKVYRAPDIAKGARFSIQRLEKDAFTLELIMN